MEVNLDVLGTVTLKSIEPVECEDNITVVSDGWTETGTRVHGVINKGYLSLPQIWKNAVLVDAGEK